MTKRRDVVTRHERGELLRFITCGSVDDGKSTLIGRLLADTRQLPDDQLRALDADSRRHGTQGAATDYALLVDGLDAEREQGITIDVAYRHFSTGQRAFIVADCPGHVQYTRNMATGASTADAAVVLVDARKGLLPQTRRHSWILSLFGVNQVVLAVNKMDLVGWSQAVFEGIGDEYLARAAQLGIGNVHAVPLSALGGDNLAISGPHSPWYEGNTLLQILETLPIPNSRRGAGFELPVQWVCRPDAEFRGFAGQLSGGPLHAGDAVVALPSGERAHVLDIHGGDGVIESAQDGAPVVLRLDRAIDITRGEVLANPRHAPEVADQFRVRLLWMDEQPLLPGRTYQLQLGSRTVNARVTALRHRIDTDTQEPQPARELAMNEVGECDLHLDAPVAFRPYLQDRALGGFILVERESNHTAGAGVIDFALHRAGNLHWQALDVDKAARAARLGQTPRCVWFTGLSGAGKSTIANAVERALHARGRHCYILDGDNVRHGLNQDLGFTDADRVENIRRVAEVARLMVDAGLIVLVSFISPFAAERRMARELFAPGEFLEVFVDVPLGVAEERDPKGLYAKARRGELPNFTGIDSPYEPPQAPELVLDAGADSLERNVSRVLERLQH